MKIDSPFIADLRKHLLDLAAHSIPPQHGGHRAQEASPEEDAIMDRFRPFAELFYLVAEADGQVDKSEEKLILGAFRALTGGRVRGTRLRELLLRFESQSQEQESMERLEHVCAALASDREDAELAFTLASAVALADNQIAQGEKDLLDTLARWLHIPQHRAQLLMLSGQKASSTNHS